jgi:hypothetical protein
MAHDPNNHQPTLKKKHYETTNEAQGLVKQQCKNWTYKSLQSL